MRSYLRQQGDGSRSAAEVLRVPAGRRAWGLLLALALEALLILALLTLGRGKADDRPEERAIATFDVSQAVTRDEQPREATRETEVAATPESAPRRPDDARTPTPPALPEAAPETPIKAPEPLVELPRDALASSDLRARPAAPARRRAVSGPPAPGGTGDTPIVAGSGPNGERLFAAAWYREPYDSELRGYLSTAQGPGWALIACRTVADFRVDDCIGLDEYPNGSRIGRAVLAAAWQFRVRPPQIGGRMMVGEWVRIRIDYTDRPRG